MHGRAVVKIGVTGTRSGMNTKQRREVTEFLRATAPDKERILHEGDCVGVDDEVAEIAAELGYRIVVHPPVSAENRAFRTGNENREPKTHFARNRSIVDESDVVVVVPFQNEHQDRGGTWYTHDYAVKKKKRVIVFYPDADMFDISGD